MRTVPQGRRAVPSLLPVHSRVPVPPTAGGSILPGVFPQPAPEGCILSAVSSQSALAGPSHPVEPCVSGGVTLPWPNPALLPRKTRSPGARLPAAPGVRPGPGGAVPRTLLPSPKAASHLGRMPKPAVPKELPAARSWGRDSR